MRKEILKTALTIAATFAACIILFKNCETQTPSIKRDFSTLGIISEYKKLQKAYFAKNDSLTKELTSLQSSLSKTKKTLYKTQNKLYELINTNSDTLTIPERLTVCDSLKIETKAYILATDSTIAKSDSIINVQSILIGIKDNQILTCDTSLSKAFAINKDLLAELNKKEKKIKRKNLLNKILAIGLIITTSFTTASLIK